MTENFFKRFSAAVYWPAYTAVVEAPLAADDSRRNIIMDMLQVPLKTMI